MNVSTIKISITLLLLVFMQACTQRNEPQNGFQPYEEVTLEPEVEYFFYNLPSPLEYSILLHSTNAKYNQESINPWQNSELYQTSTQIALNLGVYGADLTYCRAFDQIQEGLLCLSANKRLIDQLGIPIVEDFFDFDKILGEIGIRDSVLNSFIEIYSYADLFLKQRNRENLAAYIVMGCWIESMYLLCYSYENEDTNDLLLKYFGEQKFAFEHLMLLFEKNNIDFSYLQIFDGISALVEAYQSLEIITSDSSIVELKYKTNINNKVEVKITPAQYQEIKNNIYKLRKQIISI